MNFGKLIVVTLLAFSAARAHALDIKPDTAAALAAAQKADQPVALHFRADWCPTCRTTKAVRKPARCAAWFTAAVAAPARVRRPGLG